MPSTTSDDVAEKIARYSLLLLKESPDKADLMEIEALRRGLTQTFGGAETPLQDVVASAVRETLSRMASEGLVNFHPDALTLETRRQLQKLFGG
ncbi:MAG: hypothetical protein IH968_05295 [Gemmatimonadetes bacterium]|nr:hypothetical protein [Gemmatimonadota bacterium]